jgi:hypothetical protein
VVDGWVMKFRRTLVPATAAIVSGLSFIGLIGAGPATAQSAPAIGNAPGVVTALLAKNTFVSTKADAATADCPAALIRRWVDLARPVTAIRTQTSWTLGGVEKVVREQREVGKIIWTTDIVGSGCTAKKGPLIWTRVPKSLMTTDANESDVVVGYLRQFSALPAEAINPTTNEDGTVEYKPADLFPLQTVRVDEATGTIVAGVGMTPETMSVWTFSGFGTKHKVLTPTTKERSLTSTKLVYKLR